MITYLMHHCAGLVMLALCGFACIAALVYARDFARRVQANRDLARELRRWSE